MNPTSRGLLDAELGGRWQARLGEMVDVLALPGWVAVHDDRLVGVATLRGAGERAELAAIVVGEGRRYTGLGSALLEGGGRSRLPGWRPRAVARRSKQI
jgi:hypothetical protein